MCTSHTHAHTHSHTHTHMHIHTHTHKHTHTNTHTQTKVIRWLLSHNPHDRPTSKELLQSPLLPLKMEDEELQEVQFPFPIHILYTHTHTHIGPIPIPHQILYSCSVCVRLYNVKSAMITHIPVQVLERTLQSTNSTQYCHLIDKLFAQEGSRVSEFSYFIDTQDNKRSLQNVKKVTTCVFSLFH